MAKHASVKWIEGFKLEGLTDNNKIVAMDTGENATAASPAQLLLQALAGCTMMDCVSIISKCRQTIDKFWVNINAEESVTHPKIYTNIHLTYNFTGKDLDASTIERAIKLSEEKYCRIHAMLSSKSKLTSSYKLNEETSN